MKTAQATKYYEDLNGRIACYEHIGCSGQWWIDNHPTIKVFETDLTRWTRMTAKDVAEFAELVKLHGNGSVCESCRYSDPAFATV